MGYYSEVAYAVVFHNQEDRDTILNRITPEQQKVVRDEANLDTPDRILFWSTSTKWYASDPAFPSFHGFEDVDSHMAFLRAAEDAEDIYSLGVFMRIGEEEDDSERNFWGEYDKPDNFPDWYELIDMRRELVIGWST